MFVKYLLWFNNRFGVLASTQKSQFTCKCNCKTDFVGSNYYKNVGNKLHFIVHVILSGSALVSNLDQQSYSTPGPVSTGTDDCLKAVQPPRFVTSHSGQLSLLPSAGRKMSAVIFCGWGVKAGVVQVG